MDPQDRSAEATVVSDGVSVRQTHGDERFDIPTIVLELTSSWDDHVTVRLVVDLPPTLDIEEVGFHPEFRRNNWSVENRRLLFEATVPPDRTITTMYAVESLQPAQLDALLENLSIDRVSPAPTRESGQSGDVNDSNGIASEEEGSLDEDRATAPGASTAVAHSGSDAEEHDSGPDAGDGTPETTSVASEQESEADPDRGGETPDHEDGTMALSAYPMAELVAELGARLSDTDSRTDNQRVRSLLDEERDGSVDTEMQVADLQRRVSDVESILESFQGRQDHDPAEAVDELDDRIGTLAEAVDAVDEQVDGVDDRLDGVAERVDTVDQRVDDRVADVEDRLDTLEEELATTRSDLDDRISDVDTRVDTVAADVETVNARLDTVADQLETIEDVVQSVEEEVATVTDDMVTVSDEVESVATDVDELAETIEGVAEDVEALGSDVATIERHQEALESEMSRLSEWRVNINNLLETLRK